MTGGDFLAWALPRLALRWGTGFQRNRRQVLHRIARRRTALGLADLAAYRAYLEAHADEWAALDGLCRVTISRFARDRPVWDALVPRLVAGRAWCAGCGAGEEPYTLAIAAASAGVALEIHATDVDDVQLRRAEAAVYPVASLRELPDDWRAAFDIAGDTARLREPFRVVRFEHRDLRDAPPDGPFELVLCRNLAFTYFDDALERRVAASLRSVMRPGGLLVVGRGERVPVGTGFAEVSPWIYTVMSG